MLKSKPSKEENYQYLVRIMQSGGVDSREKAESHIDGLMKKSWRFSIIPIAVLILGAVLAPKLLFFWWLFGLFGLAWIWCSTYATTQMMKRYIKEEFGDEAIENH